MKKIILVLLVTIITLTGCELNNNPNSKVEELLGKYQMLDDSINVTSYPISNSTNLDNDTEEEYRKIIEKQYKNLSYEIKIATENSFASENIMRQTITKESLKKLDEIEEENLRKERKIVKNKNFKKVLENFTNLNFKEE